jgi:glycosyltransferase involved in cell wall biosynthesis
MTSIDTFLNRGVSGKKRVCLVTSIFHGFGKIGGFGTMAKSLAIALVDEGYDVVIAVPRRKGQAQVTEVCGFTVLGLTMSQMVNPKLYARIRADLYHSQSPNLMSVAAKIGNPDAKHVITCRDPRTIGDWLIEIRDATWRRKLRNIALMMFEEGPLVSWAIRSADCVAYAARFLEEKINRMYRPRIPLTFLPNIERVPDAVPTKFGHPTACFVGRFDRRKRPELYIELAKSVPDVEFLMVGKAEDANWQKTLEKMAEPISNLRLLGYIDKFDDDNFYDVYESSWVFVNTASREAHPLTFFEAAGRGCAILSYVNPDNFASEFGYWAADEDFEKGLRTLLEKGDWQRRGQAGYEYVKENYNYKKAAQAHMDVYARLLHS